MKITDETVEYVAALAKLHFEEDKKEKVKEDLERILTYIDTMNTWDTNQVEPTAHSISLTNVWREDIVTNKEQRDEILKNAPKQKDGCYLVPKTVE